MMDLSAFILAYNEVDNIPGLMESLKGVRDVVVVDNGSTDETAKLFREHGARVYDGTYIGIGKYTVTEKDVDLFRERFSYEPLFLPGEILRHSGERRNHAASLCRNDWVVNPDCDERLEWDLKKVRASLNGQPGLSHKFVHKHNSDGTPLIEFIQCKLYNRRLSEFVGMIHEVVISREKETAIKAEFSPDFVLHHWQKEREYRKDSIKYLQFQAVRWETVRNLHYLGREHTDQGEWDKAIQVYGRYFKIDSGDFPQQRSQAHICNAEAFRNRGNLDLAIEEYHRAMMMDDARRDPFFLLGQLFMEFGEWKKALIYLTAANAIPYDPKGFMNDMRLYTWAVHDKLSVCYQRLGIYDAARAHWLEALKYLPDEPDGSRILANGKWIMKLPSADVQKGGVCSKAKS